MTDEQNVSLMLTIAILGGTGKEGAGLAKRWALNGYRVIIGSRDVERAQSKASEYNEQLGGDYITGMENADAAKEAQVVVLSVPYSAHSDTLESVKDQLGGKILIDVTVPLDPSNVSTVNIPEGISAAMEAKSIVGDDVRVVSAFQNVSYLLLKDPNTEVECDIFVTGDDLDAKRETIELVKAAGMRGIDAGPLANSVVAEALTSVLAYINKTYKVKSSGIRITNID